MDTELDLRFFDVLEEDAALDAAGAVVLEDEAEEPLG